MRLTRTVLAGALLSCLLLTYLLTGCASESATTEQEPASTESEAEVNTPPEIVTPSQDQPSGIAGRQLCYITDLSQEGDTYLATVDFAVWLTGDEAETLAGGDLPNGYYILNDNPRQWVFPIDAGAEVVLLDAATPAEPVSVADLAAVWSQDAGRDAYKQDVPYWITIENDVVLVVEEQYIP